MSYMKRRLDDIIADYESREYTIKQLAEKYHEKEEVIRQIMDDFYENIPD